MLPKKYAWLAREPGPKMLLQAIALHGIVEGAGAKDNPVILAWARECGIKGYAHDSIAWCGLTMAIAAKRSGWAYKPAGNPLWARSWLQWGRAVKVAMLGDVLVFARGTGGHVGLYVGEDADCYHVLGGNQSNAVTITRVKRSRLLGARRPQWKVAQPKNVRIVKMTAAGPVSSNEA